MKLGPSQLFTVVALSWVLSAFVACQNLAYLDYEMGVGQRLFHETNLFSVFSISIFTSLYLLLKFRPVAALTFFPTPFLAFYIAFHNLPTPGIADIYWLKDTGYVQIEVSFEKRFSKRLFIGNVVKQRHPENLKTSGKILVSFSKELESSAMEAGQVFIIEGRVKPTASHHKGSRGREIGESLRRKRIYSKIHALHIEPLKNETNQNRLDIFITEMRDFIMTSHRKNIGEVRGDLLSSIVLGDRSVSLNNEVKDQFRKVGLSHLLAASGFNLSILVGAIYFSSSLISRSRRVTSAIAIGAISAFVALAGLSASVSRAALMGVFIILTRTGYRRANALSILTLTLLLFAIADPVSLLDIGLELSYAATYAIVIGIKQVDCILSSQNYGRIRKWFVELIAVILLAQSAVLPIQLYYFWEMGVLFLLANLMADPIVAPITVSGFLSSTLLIFSKQGFPLSTIFMDSSHYLDKFASYPLSYMLYLVKTLASFDSCTLYPGKPFLWTIFFYFITFFLMISNLTRRYFLPLYTGLYFAALSFFFLDINSSTSWIGLTGNNLVVHKEGKSLLVNKVSPYSINRYLKSRGYAHLIDSGTIPVQSFCQLNLREVSLVSIESQCVSVIAGLKNNKIQPLKFSSLKRNFKTIASLKHAKPWVFWTRGKRPCLSELNGSNTYFVSPASNFIRIERTKTTKFESPKTNKHQLPSASLLKATEDQVSELSHILTDGKRSTVFNTKRLKFILD